MNIRTWSLDRAIPGVSSFRLQTILGKKKSLSTQRELSADYNISCMCLQPKTFLASNVNIFASNVDKYSNQVLLNSTIHIFEDEGVILVKSALKETPFKIKSYLLGAIFSPIRTELSAKNSCMAYFLGTPYI